MKKYNSIVISKKNYEDEFQFWQAINDFMKLLSENDYIIMCRLEENNYFVIEFNENSYEFADALPYWLTWSEYDRLVTDEDMKLMNEKEIW